MPRPVKDWACAAAAKRSGPRWRARAVTSWITFAAGCWGVAGAILWVHRSRRNRGTGHGQEHPAAKRLRKQTKSRMLRVGVVVEPSQLAAGSAAAKRLRKQLKSLMF